MGTVVPMLAIKLIIQPWYALRAAEMTIWEFINKGLGRVLIVGALFAIATIAIPTNTETTLPVLVITVAVQSLIFCAATWFLGLTRIERQWASEYIRNICGGLYTAAANPSPNLLSADKGD